GFLFVRAKGLEPSHREAPDPKSGVSTNFTTPAAIGFCIKMRLQIYAYFSNSKQKFKKIFYLKYLTSFCVYIRIFGTNFHNIHTLIIISLNANYTHIFPTRSYEVFQNFKHSGKQLF